MKYETDEEVLSSYNVLHRRLSQAVRSKDQSEIDFCKKLLLRFYMEVGTERVNRVTGKDKRGKGGRKPKYVFLQTEQTNKNQIKSEEDTQNQPNGGN